MSKHPNPQEVTQQIANTPIPWISPDNFKAILLDLAGPFNIKLCRICKEQRKWGECKTQ